MDRTLVAKPRPVCLGLPPGSRGPASGGTPAGARGRRSPLYLRLRRAFQELTFQTTGRRIPDPSSPWEGEAPRTRVGRPGGWQREEVRPGHRRHEKLKGGRVLERRAGGPLVVELPLLHLPQSRREAKPFAQRDPGPSSSILGRVHRRTAATTPARSSLNDLTGPDHKLQQVPSRPLDSHTRTVRRLAASSSPSPNQPRSRVSASTRPHGPPRGLRCPTLHPSCPPEGGSAVVVSLAHLPSVIRRGERPSSPTPKEGYLATQPPYACGALFDRSILVLPASPPEPGSPPKGRDATGTRGNPDGSDRGTDNLCESWGSDLTFSGGNRRNLSYHTHLS